EATMLIAGALQGLEHIGGIVRELGRFSNADAPGPEVLQVDKLIESVRQLASNQLRELTHFSIALADPSLAVLVNGQQTRQILLNLMGNALRAVEGMSSRELRLAVSSAGEDAVQFTVSDNGSGIDDSVRERIFEPFITSRLGAGGTGLGLSIARQLAFANGGELDLVSSGPDGTCFRLTVPRVRVESGVPDVVVEPVPRLRVLLIDDDARVLKAHARKLSKRYQVNAQLGGEAGLAALLIGDHDVVLCDLMMPDIGGLELYRAVVETQAELAKRIVFVTGGVANAADRLEIERLGLRVVGKPIDMGRLAAAIAEVLGA
ncbi:MAG: CheY-like chemotaxis protein, partial [Myxococcota bacterium]